VTVPGLDFCYSGASLLGAATNALYTYTWSNVPAGSYTFTAVATDISNVSTTSSPASVSVGAAAVTQIYYIYTDQLNTPRLITDTANTPVWRNDQADPFNAGAPYDDPGNTGQHFVFNLRFPGQYYDQETGLAYNYFRDYDATTGRYVQSDPIGLMGGINTYTYVGGDPVSYADPLGLSPLPSQTPPTNPNPISGPYNAPDTWKDWVTDKIGDAVFKQLTGLGGLVTKSPLAIAIPFVIHSDGLGGCDNQGHCADMMPPSKPSKICQ